MTTPDPPVSSDPPSEPERPVQVPPDLPVLPLRDTVLFPNSFMPLAVAREASVRLVEEASAAGRLIGVFTQREASIEEPMQEDLFPVGTVTHIHKLFKLPDGSLRLIVQGLARVTLDKIVQARGNTAFVYDWSKKPAKLDVSFDNEVSWSGTKR